MKLQLTHHFDPAHGWVETPYSLVAVLGIREKITHYSYYSQSKQVFYLEEDGDANTLLEALTSRGVEFEIISKEHVSMTFIRRLPRVGVK